MKAFFFTLLLLLLLLVLLAGIVVSGVYDVGADTPHSRPVFALLQLARQRSIEMRTAGMNVPDLEEAARIRQGAGNYDAMCTGCHLKPGMADSELHRGLYPQPPALATVGIGPPAAAFWTIKHGIKATGMPAWGKSMQDEYIWNMVAFLRRLPKLSPEQYQAEVAASGGHTHGGGEDHHHEDGEHAHDGGEEPHHEGDDHPHDDHDSQGHDGA